MYLRDASSGELESSAAPARPRFTTPGDPGRPAGPSAYSSEVTACHRTARRRRSPRTRWPTAPTSTRSSARTSPDTVTLIANYIPLEGPAGGPNFYAFGDEVLYEIHVDNNGDARAGRHLPVPVPDRAADPGTFLYNTGPILSLGSANWNSRQTYTVTRIKPAATAPSSASGLACPPCNIGPLSTPELRRAWRAPPCTACPAAIKVFAGQRAEGFYVDLGAIFDLGDLRPFEKLHAQYGMNVFSGPAAGVNATAQLNVHSIAIQVPVQQLGSGQHGKVTDQGSVIGVWTTASRQRVSVWDADRRPAGLAAARSTRCPGWGTRSSTRC